MSYADAFNYNTKIGVKTGETVTFVNGQPVYSGGTTTFYQVSMWLNQPRETFVENKKTDFGQYTMLINPKTMTMQQVRALKQITVYDEVGAVLFTGDVIMPDNIGTSNKIYKIGVNKVE